MNKFEGLDFYDFEFNGERLSSFGGCVGSSDGGLKTYSILPARSRVTDRPLNSDITYEFSSALEPRTFEVPIVFEQIRDGDLRKIAAWLDSPTPSKFRFIGDDVYINAELDSTDFNAQSTSGQDAQIALKFICHDPYYYDFNMTKYRFEEEVVASGLVFEVENKGYGEIYPNIKISCTGDTTINIRDASGKIYRQSHVSNIVGGVIIDSTTLECTLFSGANHFQYIDKFPAIPQGKCTIEILTDTFSYMTVEFRNKYI